MHEDFDIPADAVGRELRAIEQDHQATLPAVRDALAIAFDPDHEVAEADKARLLGVPDRRGFLKLGGLTVGLSALAVACVYPDKTKEQLPNTGTYIPAASTSIPPNPGSAVVDATLVLTAISIEQLAIDTYTAALDAGWLMATIYQDVAKYFRDQHQAHRALLESVAKDLGQNGSAVAANEYLNTNVVSKAVDAIKAEAGTPGSQQTDTLTLARTLEDAAGQTYAQAGGILTTPELRQGILSIGSIEAKHFTLLTAVLSEQPVPFAFQHTNGAAPPASYIKPDESTIPSTTAPEPKTSGTATTGTRAP